MPYFPPLPEKDRLVVRALAQRQKEISESELNQQRVKLWYSHNSLEGSRPMIHIETYTFSNEVTPPLQCESETGRQIEWWFHHNIINHELVGDDRPVDPYFGVFPFFEFKLFGLDVEVEHSTNSQGNALGHQFKYAISDLQSDYPKLGKTRFSVDREKTLAWKQYLEEVFGDILPVKLKGSALTSVLTQKVVHLMGMENMLMSVYDYPDLFKRFMEQISDDHLAFFNEMEKNGDLLPMTAFETVGQGTFAFNRELKEGTSGEQLKLKDVWGFMDSQETVGMSPTMFAEFVFPYYKRIAEKFGLLSYGCCEPVHTIWDSCLSKLENLRKVSISPWCDESMMGERLAGKKIIYHRKPSPNFIGVGKALDEEGWRKHIRHTLEKARGCKLEITQRDVYTVENNPGKLRRAVEIIREEIDANWKG